ncbi:hypothetical protein COCON_G00209100 [Conger conger]|uniref:ENTH domain-containing protein n=1 Tax=Conger conger TaxID=82655 RepID=A0A9Q1D0S3_CONCO|nr:epsin-2-like [Conger conger]KAJ8254298.1 hypothetical protein COCON_G00209100 [Conger conger]
MASNMPSSTIRRQMKNMVNNYSEAEKKVREATSNDPWGPSSSLMSEIADLTYNVVAFSEIMSMIWKRLNDHGKNWRHVYKALTLLDYLIKTGSERVALQCKENIFAIQTLKDFQYVDRDGKDQGVNVREKSKQLVVLLKDDERLKGERCQALKTKERMAQVAPSAGSSLPASFGRGSSQPNLSSSYSGDDYGKSEGSPASYHGSTSPNANANSELEQARPQTSGEEELQLQLALAMSREAAEQEERVRRGDDLRLQMALEESRKGPGKGPVAGPGKVLKKKEAGSSGLMDMMSGAPGGPVAQATDPWASAGATVGAAAAAPDPWQSFGAASKPPPAADPWGAPSISVAPVKSSDPWGSSAAPTDPWAGGAATRPKASGAGEFDLFGTLNGTSREDLSDFDSLRSSSIMTGEARGSSTLPSQPSLSASSELLDMLPGGPSRKTPESFLGPNAALVNLDTLVTVPPQPAPISNPFLSAGPAPPPAQVNPFQVLQPQPPTLNQMRGSPLMGVSAQAFAGGAQMSSDPLPLSSLPPSLLLPSALPPQGAMGHMMQGVSMGPMSLPQPLMSTALPPQGPPGQAATTTNPFLL